MSEPAALLPRVKELYAAYLDKTAELERTRSLFAGALGMRGGPADDPCHDRFAEDLRALLDEAAGAGLPSGELRELLALVYAPPEKDCPRCAYWMLLAVHGMSAGLIDQLSPDDARALAERYRKDWPRHRRLPAQDQVCKALLAQRG